jgi:MtfA peptidase
MNFYIPIHKLTGFITRRLVVTTHPFGFFDPEIPDILEKHFDFYNHLLTSQKLEFNRKVFILIKCKNFIGMKGFEINKYHKIIIAALATRLILKLGLKYFDHIHRIYIFESEFNTVEYQQPVNGITGFTGSIGLSWHAVKEGIESGSDGNSIIIHEFAHALDLYDGNFDGLPLLFKPGIMQPFIDQIYKEHEKICNRIENWLGIVQRYKIEDISEFFAVLTEIYFEKPELLMKKNKSLYDLLKKIYRYEPGSLTL